MIGFTYLCWMSDAERFLISNCSCYAPAFLMSLGWADESKLCLTACSSNLAELGLFGCLVKPMSRKGSTSDAGVLQTYLWCSAYLLGLSCSSGLASSLLISRIPGSLTCIETELWMFLRSLLKWFSRPIWRDFLLCWDRGTAILILQFYYWSYTSIIFFPDLFTLRPAL